MPTTILVVEIGKGDRWTQVNFPKKVMRSYFNIDPDVEQPGTRVIRLKHYLPSGRKGQAKDRPFVSVPSQNFRFEMRKGAEGKDYPKSEKRPIAVIAKEEADVYRYVLLFPDDANYNAASSFLATHYKGFAHHLRRAQTDNAGLTAFWENHPL